MAGASDHETVAVSDNGATWVPAPAWLQYTSASTRQEFSVVVRVCRAEHLSLFRETTVYQMTVPIIM